ncbi:MAG: NAD(P)-dependent alcohol dehydrogenase [bacterium]|nr:NAD(P)-dependent alcohol dehydrogenase [bacterium]
MKAAIYTSYGPPEVIRLVNIKKPYPKPNEVLIKVYATTVTSGDVRLRAFDFPFIAWLPARLIFGFFTPRKKILGHEFSGVVEQVGKNITKFKIGDPVMGTTSGLNSGSHAEFICVPESWKSGVLLKKPIALSFEEAAALPVGAMTALYLLKKASISKSKNVLIYGSSGSVGSYAIQLGKVLGGSVTAVCGSRNSKLMKSLGAVSTIDYKTQDYTSLEKSLDIVFDAIGKTTKKRARKVLTKGGVFVTVNSLTAGSAKDLKELSKLVEQKQIQPVIDRVFSLDQIIEAHSYVESGHKTGNVVIKLF